jgi:hypothetical protein
MQWGERPDYENVPKEQKQFMKVEPVNFNQEHKEMLGHCKMLLERGYIAINPAFQDRKEKKGYETIDYYEAAGLTIQKVYLCENILIALRVLTT